MTFWIRRTSKGNDRNFLESCFSALNDLIFSHLSFKERNTLGKVSLHFSKGSVADDACFYYFIKGPLDFHTPTYQPTNLCLL